MSDNITIALRRKLALVIGIGDYEDGRKLQNAEKDAHDMSSLLERIGFKVTKEVNLTCRAMKHILIDFIDSVREKDMILLYFAGHGAQSEYQNYLIPKDNVDIDSADLKNRAVDAQRILNDLNDRKPFIKIFLLDCCRVYQLPNGQSNGRTLNTNESKSVGLIAMHEAGSLIAFACAPGTIADDGQNQQNGLFTKHLLQHIATPNEDILNILRDVTAAVINESNGRQVPFFAGSLPLKNIYLFETTIVHVSETPRENNIFNTISTPTAVAISSHAEAPKTSTTKDSRYRHLSHAPTDPSRIKRIDGTSEKALAGSNNFLVVFTDDKLSIFNRSLSEEKYLKWNGGPIVDICLCSAEIGFILLTESKVYQFSARNHQHKHLTIIQPVEGKVFSTCASNGRLLLISYNSPGTPIDEISTSTWKLMKQRKSPTTCGSDEYINRLRYSRDMSCIGMAIYSNRRLRFELRDDNLNILRSVFVCETGCCGVTSMPQSAWLLSDGHLLYAIDQHGVLTIIERQSVLGAYFDLGNLAIFANDTIVIRSPKALYFY